MKPLFIMAAVVALLGVVCSKKEAEQEVIMARINGRTLTEHEFLERAEYTIRPPYAKMDYYAHKKIILNSLIAEALLAQDRGASTELAKNQKFQLFVQGQKEQAMRQMFYRKHFYDPIKLDPQEVQKVYNLAGRTYDVQFLSTKNKVFSDLIEQRVRKQNLPFDQVVLEYTGLDSLSARKVSFDMNDIPQVRQALFEQEVKRDQVIGPLQIGNEYLWLQVRGWREVVSLNTQDVQNRSRDVVQHLTFKYATESFQRYVVRLMKGKRVEFDQDTFVELVNTLGPVFFPSKEDKEAQLKRLVWKKGSEDDLPIDSLSTQLSRLKEKPLLTIDGTTWTVADLDRELLLHPLNFRKKKMRKNEFAEQLKLAVVDIIRDKYITQQAYREGFDAHPYVQSREAMWRDAYLASAARNEYLASLGLLDVFEKEYLPIIEKELNPLVDELQSKYSGNIEINTDLLESIQLSRIDLFALYEDQPYPMVVPPFPLLTTDHLIDYGRKLVDSDKITSAEK